ncbi:hypothetical protein LCGC14_2228380 [marine sediment metagenome]|uniref:Uncharacterized protein n=1 Tax=marine sediment metagenome TaxID=412755 RepID=A0A0F9G489_9ZZZZ
MGAPSARNDRWPAKKNRPRGSASSGVDRVFAQNDAVTAADLAVEAAHDLEAVAGACRALVELRIALRTADSDVLENDPIGLACRAPLHGAQPTGAAYA